MKNWKETFFGLLLLLNSSLFAQTTSSMKFHSEVLNVDRNIRVHLPKSFDAKSEVKYPLILSLDGEYLFYSILGTVEVLTITETIPETIIVGIDQNYPINGKNDTRWTDCSYSSKTGLIDEKGSKFKSFIETELLPMLTEKYNIGKFKVIAGHSFTANYVNFFLEDETFTGFIEISPYTPTSMEDYLTKTIAGNDKNKFLFLCTGEKDFSAHKAQIGRQDSTIFSQTENSNFKYKFADYPNENHMSLTLRGIPDAISFMFSGLCPISVLNNEEELMKEKDLMAYLINRYDKMNSVYGMKMPFREDDLFFLSYIMEEQENWTQLKTLGQLEVGLFPESVYGYFMLATAEEKNNNLALALELYKKGYSKLGDDTTNKSDFYGEIERVEKLLKEKK